jgi:thiamine biosynthesis lipoprotein
MIRSLACCSAILARCSLVLLLPLGCQKAAPEPSPEQSATASPSASAAPSASVAAAPPAVTEPVRIERKEPSMGTLLHFIAYATDDRAGQAAIDAALGEMRRLEALLSEWQATSEVGRVNAGAGSWVAVGPDTLHVIERSLWAGKVSQGAFDITFQVMHGLWNFGTAADEPPRVPAAAEIDERRALIDYRKVELDAAASKVKIPAGRSIGLGGIAKGYIVDRAARVLREQGLTRFLVQAGGDLYGAGRKPDGSPWVSGVRDPRGSDDAFFAQIELEDHAFSTAGDYARSYVVGGKRYHHIIDPHTGYPATRSRSVTIWAPDALTADAVDDAVFILGPERGLALVESLAGVGAVIVDANNKVHVSRRLLEKVRILRAPTDGL